MGTTTWVVVADEAIARILEKPAGAGELQPVEELTDPDAHIDRADMRRDAYGRRGAGGVPRPGIGGSFNGGDSAQMSGTNVTSGAGDDELHKEAQGFARRVAQRLAEAHQQRRFDELHLVCAPRFLGYLRRELKPEVGKAVAGSMDKDFVHLGNDEIYRRVFEPRAA